MKYYNYKLRTFFNKASRDAEIYERYMSILKYLTYSNKLLNFECGSLMEIEFIKVRTIQKKVSGEYDMVELVSYVTGISEKKLLKVRIFKFFMFYNWVLNEIERINNAEANAHDYSPDGKQLSAGIENLYKFDVFGEIDGLAGGDITKHDAVSKLPYHVVFTKIWLNIEQNRFEKNYSKLLTNGTK